MKSKKSKKDTPSWVTNRHITELAGNLMRNSQMWETWKEHGVTENTHLNVDFFFIAPNTAAKDNLVQAAQAKGLETHISTNWRWFFKKSFYCKVTFPAQKWTLEKLQEQTKEMWSLAGEAHDSIELDGSGASMPS